MRRTKRDLAEVSPERDQMQDQVVADPEVFARNLERLTQMADLTRNQVAALIGAKYQWYRRIVTKGLSRIRQGHRAYLEELAKLFRLDRVEDLWKPDLIVFRVKRVGLPPQADPQEELEWYQEELVPIAKKLGQLLATGKHDYLKELIARLHDTLPKDEDEA